ncbi:MAG: phospholipid carrier-dependent glycosyltransferase, partial [Planctomycetaceae bacterium]
MAINDTAITDQTSRRRLTQPFCIGLLIVLCLVLYLPGTWQMPLADPEESRCALIVQHMIQSGEWLMPHLDGDLYFDKPAPYFWLAAVGQLATGNIEFSGRLVSALFAIAAVLMAFSAGRRMGGNLAGLVAGIVLATSVEFVFMARWYRMDMPLATLVWAALWWFWRYET